MKHLFISIFLVFLFSLSANAQSWKWARTQTTTTAPWIIEGYAAACDQQGNVFAGGDHIDSSISFGSSTFYNRKGMLQAIWVKYDSLGNLQWAHAADSGMNTNVGLNGLATSRNGDLLVLGIFDRDSIKFGSFTLINTTHNYYSDFLLKYSAGGGLIWAKSIPLFNSGAFAAGGAVTCDTAGNIYVTGTFVDTVSIDTFTLRNSSNTYNDIAVIKYDKNGNALWAKSAGGSSNDVPVAIQVSKGGEVYVSGFFKSPVINFGSSVMTLSGSALANLFLLKYDASGNPIWAKSASGAVHANMVGMAIDSLENTYITASFDANSISFDNITLTRNYVVTGAKAAATLVKYDSSGKAIWAKMAETRNLVYAHSVSCDKWGKVWWCGSIMDSINIDGHVLLPPGGSGDPLFLAEFDTSGNYVQALAMQAGGDDGSGIVCDDFGNLYICGDYWQSVFVVGPDTLHNPCPNVNLSQGEVFFVSKLHYYDPPVIPTQIEQEAMKSEFVLFPNPACNKFEISYTGKPLKNGRVLLYNITGKLVSTSVLGGPATLISADGLAPGMYICKITAEGQEAITRKILIGK